MMFYLLKRLLWMVPTLWFITSVVFILSTLIPANTLFSDESSASVKNRQDKSGEQIYKHYLQRTGQDLPVFYFSLHTLAEPDTLHRILSEQKYRFAKRMVLNYGNWPAITDYLLHLQHLETQVANIRKEVDARKTATRQVEILYTDVTSEKVKPVFEQLKKTAYTTSISIELLTRIEQVERAFEKVVHTQSPYLNWIPAIAWHGIENQYHKWMIGLIKGDMGISYRDARPVTESVAEAFVNTLLLTVLTSILLFSTAVLVNLFIIHEDHRRWQKPVLIFLYVLDTIPVFLLALLLLIMLAATDALSLFPIYGMGSFSGDSSWTEALVVQLYHLMLPTICLAIGNIPYVATQLYQAMQETAIADFITSARAKGVTESWVVSKHILRNALLPLITLFSGFLPALLGGALVIEVIFAIPGMGSLLVESILARDFPLLLGIVLVLAFVKVISHILADMLYYLADPRIRF